MTAKSRDSQRERIGNGVDKARIRWLKRNEDV
jgi:hypothetical protein